MPVCACDLLCTVKLSQRPVCPSWPQTSGRAAPRCSQPEHTNWRKEKGWCLWQPRCTLCPSEVGTGFLIAPFGLGCSPRVHRGHRWRGRGGGGEAQDSPLPITEQGTVGGAQTGHGDGPVHDLYWWKAFPALTTTDMWPSEKLASVCRVGAAGTAATQPPLATVAGPLPVLGQLPPEARDERPYKNNSESVPQGVQVS